MLSGKKQIFEFLFMGGMILFYQHCILTDIFTILQFYSDAISEYCFFSPSLSGYCITFKSTFSLPPDQLVSDTKASFLFYYFNLAPGSKNEFLR